MLHRRIVTATLLATLAVAGGAGEQPQPHQHAVVQGALAQGMADFDGPLLALGVEGTRLSGAALEAALRDAQRTAALQLLAPAERAQLVVAELVARATAGDASARDRLHAEASRNDDAVLPPTTDAESLGRQLGERNDASLPMRIALACRALEGLALLADPRCAAIAAAWLSQPQDDHRLGASYLRMARLASAARALNAMPREHALAAFTRFGATTDIPLALRARICSQMLHMSMPQPMLRDSNPGLRRADVVRMAARLLDGAGDVGVAELQPLVAVHGWSVQHREGDLSAAGAELDRAVATLLASERAPEAAKQAFRRASQPRVAPAPSAPRPAPPARPTGTDGF